MVEKIEGFIAPHYPGFGECGGYSGSDARCFLLAGCVAGLGVSGCRGAQPVPAILQFYGEKGKGVHGHLLRRAGKDECIRCAICAGNARGEDFRTECPLVSSVQRRDSGLQDLCLEVLRHIPERDDSFYRPAQFTGDVHSSYGYFVDTSQSAVAFVGGGVAIFHHHGTCMTSPVYKLTFLGGNTRDINEG